MSVRHLLPPTVPSSDTQVRLVFLGTSLNIKDDYSAAKPKRAPINQKMVECMSRVFFTVFFRCQQSLNSHIEMISFPCTSNLL